MTELEAFREFVLRADLSDDATFTQVLQRGAKELGIDPGNLASTFRVSRPTATRWLNGVTWPAVGVRESVRRGFLALIEKRLG